jgi:hypothetical protein
MKHLGLVVADLEEVVGLQAGEDFQNALVADFFPAEGALETQNNRSWKSEKQMSSS